MSHNALMNSKTKFSKPIEFPCEFAIKIVGEASDFFEEKVNTIIKRHCAEEDIKDISKRHSKQGNYLALTVTVYVENQAQLDSIYIELSSTPEILMAL